MHYGFSKGPILALSNWGEEDPISNWLGQDLKSGVVVNMKVAGIIDPAKVIELTVKYKIECIAFDRWNASQLVIQLTNDGANMKPFGQ